jgi:hypothetical protein
MVCRKGKLKNFMTTKTAGGCGVVPILFATHLFCQSVCAPIEHGAMTDYVVVEGRRVVLQAVLGYLLRLNEWGYKVHGCMWI